MRIAYVKGQEFCDVLCFLEDNCFSYNFMTISETGKQKCELNNATHEGHERDLKKDMDYEYYAADQPIIVDHSFHGKLLNVGRNLLDELKSPNHNF